MVAPGIIIKEVNEWYKRSKREQYWKNLELIHRKKETLDRGNDK